MAKYYYLMLGLAHFIWGLLMVIWAVAFVAIVGHMNLLLVAHPHVYITSRNAYLKYVIIVLGVLYLIHGALVVKCIAKTGTLVGNKILRWSAAIISPLGLLGIIMVPRYFQWDDKKGP